MQNHFENFVPKILIHHRNEFVVKYVEENEGLGLSWKSLPLVKPIFYHKNWAHNTKVPEVVLLNI
jgi:hypothetical protein